MYVYHIIMFHINFITYKMKEKKSYMQLKIKFKLN